MYRTLLLVVIVVLAGCAGPFPSDEATDSPDPTTATPPTAAPATDSPSPTASPTPARAESPTVVSTASAVDPPAATFAVDGESNPTVTLEVADNETERTRGLMHRESLERNHGMLFVFGSESTKSFWMKNTLIPLDMIFVDANGTVVNVEHAAVQPNASDGELESYRSDGPAKYVIEVNRGFANRTGVESGTRVEFHGNETLLTPEG